MAVPPLSPKSNAPFFVISLASHNSNPIVPDAFFTTHLEGKNELTTLMLLTSDAYDRTWQVKLNGRRFADGWKDFSDAHCLRDDDVLLFRDDGQMIFHVTPLGRSFSQIHYISSSFDDSEGDDDSEDNDKDDDSEDDEGDDHGDETWDKVSDLRNNSPKTKSRLKTESSSSENSCVLGVTSSNRRLNRVTLAKRFTVTNGLHKSCCEIDLMNQCGKSWVMGLRHNKKTGEDFIRGGWTSFSRANKLKTGCFYRFELVRTRTRPALKLCSDNTPPQRNCSKAKVSGKPSKFMTVTLKPYMLKSRQLHLRSSFARENGIKKGGKINLVDKHGGVWPSCVASANVQGGVYLSKGLIFFCKACGITTGETFTLKFVREKDKTPMLRFFSKAKTKIEEAPRDKEVTETRFQKKARVFAGEPSRRTHASHKSTVDTNNLQCKQPLETISHQVRQSIMDVVADVRRFRSELEIKEQNLEAVLEEMDVLGEKVSEINKFFK